MLLGRSYHSPPPPPSLLILGEGTKPHHHLYSTLKLTQKSSLELSRKSHFPLQICVSLCVSLVILHQNLSVLGKLLLFKVFNFMCMINLLLLTPYFMIHLPYKPHKFKIYSR